MGTLVFVSGSGYGNTEEDGRFKVEHAERTKYFDKLSKAKAYYQNLNVAKSIWDVTNVPELLESHSFEQ